MMKSLLLFLLFATTTGLAKIRAEKGQLVGNGSSRPKSPDTNAPPIPHSTVMLSWETGLPQRWSTDEISAYEEFLALGD